MNIVAEYDSSVANAPAGFKQAVQAAIDYYDQLIRNPITVTIMFSYGELDGSQLGSGTLGESSTNGYVESYSTLVSQLTAAATSQADKQSIAGLPANDPTNGASFWVSDTEAKIFGQGSNPNFTDPEDGFVALASKYSFTYDPTNRSVAGEYDAIGVLEHEISEAIGRIGYLGTQTFQNGGNTYTLYSPLDLFRFDSSGNRDLTPGPGYFGVAPHQNTLLYNDPTNGGDADDWDSSVYGDSYGDGFKGQAGVVSPTDVLEMGVLGFNVAPPINDDFNGDNVSDILIQSNSGEVVVGELVNGSEVYTGVAALGSEWTFHGSGDFLGDGNTDFLIENNGGAVYLGEVADGKTTYTSVSALGPEWSFKGTGDFLGSGLSDYLIENTSGSVFVGEVSAGAAQYTAIGALGPEWKFVGVGEFMGDAISDFLIENTSGAVDVGEVVNGKAQYTQVAALGSEWTFKETGDFLGNGNSQFLMESTSGEVVLGSIVDGQAQYTAVGSLGPEWTFVGAGVYSMTDNIPGRASFLIENTSGQVYAGTVSGGQAQYVGITGLGSEWSFRG